MGRQALLAQAVQAERVESIAVLEPNLRVQAVQVERPMLHRIDDGPGAPLDGTSFPALVGVLAPPTTAPAVVGGAPLLDSQVGNVFHDAGDPALLWHLPGYELAPDPDASFAFAAQQDKADDHGHPFNIATLTFGLRHAVPADAAAALAAQPGARLQEIPTAPTEVVLNLPFTSSDGSDQIRMIPGTATAVAGGLLLTFTGLLGDNVILAFVGLTTTGAASVSLTLSYDVDDEVPRQRWWSEARQASLVGLQGAQTLMLKAAPQRSALIRPRRFAETAGPMAIHVSDAATNEMRPIGDDPFMIADDGSDPGVVHVLVPIDDEPTEPETTTIRRSTTTTFGLPVGSKFAGSGYRPSYTVMSKGARRAIINTDDLEQFNVVQSQFQELTSLGDVATRYPSLRALYVGLVSGTVVAVPAAYGIQRTPQRCEASCDAVVDSGSALSTGCRFHLSFTLAPEVDPGDLVRLAADLLTAPSLPARDWKVVLPSDLDRRTAPAFTSPLVNATMFALGADPHTFLVGVDIQDDAIPAVVKVNAFLKQLSASGPAPLVGRLAVRLDDAYPSPVQTNVILDLHTTGGDQELVVQSTGPGSATVQNVAPYDLRLEQYTSRTAASFMTVPLDQALPGGETITLSAAADAEILAVHRSLSLPDPMPPALLADYVTFRTSDVQRVHHLLGVNATSVLGGTAPGKPSGLSIEITLDGAPDVDIPTLTLDAGRPVDKATVDIPVQSAFTGLAATVSIAVLREGVPEPIHVSLTHDFFSSPIFVVTPAVLGLG